MSKHLIRWRKSSLSKLGGGSDEWCVEAAKLDKNTIGIRDSKDSTGEVLTFTDSEWQDFLDKIKNRTLNL